MTPMGVYMCMYIYIYLPKHIIIKNQTWGTNKTPGGDQQFGKCGNQRNYSIIAGCAGVILLSLPLVAQGVTRKTQPPLFQGC